MGAKEDPAALAAREKFIAENRAAIARIESGVVAASGEKMCPQCAEQAKGAAAVCRWCGYDFKEKLRYPVFWRLATIVLAMGVFFFFAGFAAGALAGAEALGFFFGLVLLCVLVGIFLAFAAK